MKRLIATVLITTLTCAGWSAESRPGTTPRAHNSQPPGQPGAPASLHNQNDPLAAAKAYYEEKSWQLVVQTADTAATATLADAAQRELSFLAARALGELRQPDQATARLEALIAANPNDAWAARAHWQLQPGLGANSWISPDQENPLEHLRQADRLLTDLKTPDLQQFYTAVVDSSLVTTRFDSKPDRDYVMSFFDKLMPLLSDENEKARVSLRRQSALDAMTDRTPEERLAGLRGIVSTYPRTPSAATAQRAVAQYYINKRDFTPAIYELNLLANQFAGTDEAREAMKEIQRIKAPEAMFQLSQQYLPGESVEFELAARNTDSVKLTAVPFSYLDELKRQQVTRLELDKVKGRATVEEKVSIDRADNYQTTTRTVALKVTEPGTYVLTATVDGKASANALLIVSDLALVGNGAATGYDFWAVNAATGRPRAGVKVTVAHDVKNDQKWLSGRSISYYTAFDSLQTDSNGFATFTGDKHSGSMAVVATDGKNVALLDNTYWTAMRERGGQPMVYLYTDRPVYRPEQKVYWRAVVRMKAEGQFSIPKDGAFTALVQNPQGQEIAREDGLKLSDAGSLSGELTLPVGAALGRYFVRIEQTRIRIEQAGSATGSRTFMGAGSFRVEEYKKPEFLVSVAAGSDFSKIGETVTAQVSANYVFGAPVAEGTVKYMVRRRPRFRLMWENISWALDGGDLGWFEEKQQRPPTLHGSGGDIVAEGDGKLDAAGHFDLKFEAKVPDEERQNRPTPRPWPIRPMGGSMRALIWPPPTSPATWDFQVEVTVTDASRRNIDASQVIPVGEKALWLTAKTDRNIVTPGDNARVELKSQNLAEKPVATSGTLAVEKLTWNEAEKRDDVTTITTQAAAIDSSGSAIITWRVPDDLHGRLRFAYITDDPFGGKSVAYANFTAATADDKDIHAQYHGVEITLDRDRYAVGDTARVMILSEYSDAVAWFWIDTGSAQLEKTIVPLPHRTNFLSIPITEAFVPNSRIHVVAVRDKRMISDDVELIVPPTRKIVNVQIVPSATTVEPGTTGTVAIRATDASGAPVSAEFSLSVFDKAITYIAPDMRDDIRRFFYGTRRPLQSDITNSLAVVERYGGVLLSEGLAYLDWNPGVGDFIAKSRSSAFRERIASIDPTSPRPHMRAAMKASATDAASAPPPAMAGALQMEANDAMGDLGVALEAEMPAIRADFRDSMFWSPAVTTDASGSATVTIKYPDSLTTWQMDAVGVTADTRVGNATTETVAKKKILVRLQTPRFLRERDELMVTGIFHNYTDQSVSLAATLRARGVVLDASTTMPLPGQGDFLGSSTNVNVAAGGEQRVDWKVRVPSAAAGNAIFNLAATSAAGSDAMQTTVPLLEHGIDKFVAWNGTSADESTTGADTRKFGATTTITRTVELPAERIRETSRLDIHIDPSLAYSIRDALPYMIDYPYGCVEQTMSRFLPAVVAAQAFDKLNIPMDAALKDRLPKVTADSLKALADMQLPSGGWGWWAGDSENLPMTCYVVYGFTLAKQAGVAVDSTMFNRGLDRLAQLRDDGTSRTIHPGNPRSTRVYVPFPNIHELAYAEYVLAMNGRGSAETVDLLWTRRDQLTPRSLSMLARTLGLAGRKADADVVLRNMLNVAVITPENNTLRWGLVERAWYWYDDAVEATAYGLMAYLDLHPDDPAVEQAMKWLVLNRQGSRWKSTRDTSAAVLALTQYLLQKHEAASDATIQVSVAGRTIKTLKLTPSDFWNFDGKITLRGNEIPDGNFPVTIQVDGSAKVYYSIFAEYFTREENIAAAGNEIYVTRTYEKLSHEMTTETVHGQSSDISREKWTPLKEGEALAAGDEIRVTLKLKALNNYEYLVFEDAKPAGLEPVDLQSGGRYGDGLCSNMELRDAWVAFFITTFPQGEHTLSYRMRAEIPGTFHAMPTTGRAMYFPPLRANSDEAIVTVHP